MIAPEARPRLFLWGFMGTGKSTVGRIIAARRKLPFIDLDAGIEREEGCSIAAIFENHGEAGFRAIEARALIALLDEPEPRVVALGGGSLLAPDLRRRALDETFVVVLEARIESILARCAGGDRPLLAGAKDAARLLAARTPAYAEAHLRVIAEAAPDRVAAAIDRLWRPEKPSAE